MTTVFRIVATLVRAWAIVLLSAHALTSVATAVVQRGSAASGSVGTAATITRTQNVSAQATSVSFSAPTTGDLIIVFAHRDGSTTPPTKVAGYTTINNATGANSNSAILAFKFSDGTETGSGTWANATSVAVLIYRNAGLGGWASTRSAGSSVTTSYGTLTMASAAGTSWVAGFGGHTTATDVGGTAPTGMTMRTATADVAAFDTGAGVASWSAQTATVNANSGWVTYTLEILPVPSGQLLWTLIQHVNTFASAGTTAAITLTQTVTAGNLLVVLCEFEAIPRDIVSVDKGGTLIPIVALQGADPEGSGMAGGYIISATAATTPITVTFAASTTPNIGLWEVHYTGTGTPALDIATHSYSASGTSPSGQAATMSGGNDVIFATGQTKFPALITAIASPFNTPTGSLNINSGQAWAAAFNQTSYTTPAWTTDNSAVSSFTGVAFGLSPTAFVTRALNDFEAGSNGADCTAALLKSSAKGWIIPTWTVVGPGAAMKFNTAANQAYSTSITRLNDGTSLTAAAGTKGVTFLTSTVQSYLKCDLFPKGGDGVTGNAFSMGIWFWSDLPAADTSNMDVFAVVCHGGVGFANCKNLSNGSGSRSFELEVPGGTSTSIAISPSTWYWLSLQYNRSGSHVLKIYNTAGTLIGTITEAHTGTLMPEYLVLGQNAGSTTPTTGYSVHFDSLKIDPAGSYPLLP